MLSWVHGRDLINGCFQCIEREMTEHSQSLYLLQTVDHPNELSENHLSGKNTKEPIMHQGKLLSFTACLVVLLQRTVHLILTPFSR